MADSLLSLDQVNEQSEREALLNKWKDKTKEEILDAKINSDLFIKTKNAQFDDLKKDYLELREQHQTSAQLKDVLDQLEKQRTQPQNQNDQTPITPRDEAVPSIKPEDISKLIADEIARNKAVDRQTQNFQTVEGKLKETFGENYQASYKQRLDSLGLSQQFADDLARNYPEVFFKTFDIGQARQESFQSPPRTNQRPSSFAPSVQKRDWAYYQELKKTNPHLYLDPKIAVQMHDDAIALGDAFGMPKD